MLDREVTNAKGATPIERVREMARWCRNDRYTDHIYAMKLLMAGDYNTVKDIAKNGAVNQTMVQGDAAEYPYIDPVIGPDGQQNHVLVSSRINIQAIVYADPEFECKTENQVSSQVNKAWIRDRWESGDWGETFYEVGMDVETCGIGFALIGVNSEGKVDIERYDPCDVLWDMTERSPGRWRHFYMRKFYDVDMLESEFGDVLTEDEIESLVSVVRTNGRYSSRGPNVSGEEAPGCWVWRYYDKTTHCVFIGSIANGIVLGLVDKGDSYEYARGHVGPNPFPCVPVATWIDSWSPGMLRPSSKAETTWRTAMMLNHTEGYLRDTLKNGKPINAFSTLGMKRELVERLEKAGDDWADVCKVVVTDTEDVRSAVMRVPGMDVPETLIYLRNELRQELNASTGVQDSQRGARTPGEKTMFEVRSFNENQGVQARHTRKKFSKFLMDIVQKARLIGSMYENVGEKLFLEDGTVDTTVTPIRLFLAEKMQIRVQENSLQYKTDEQSKYERLMQFQQVDFPGIQAGAVDARQVFMDVYTKLGVVAPERMLAQGGQPSGPPSQPPVAEVSSPPTGLRQGP